MYLAIHEYILKFYLGVIYKMIDYGKGAIHLQLLLGLDHRLLALGLGSLALLYLLADVVGLKVLLKGDFLVVGRSDHQILLLIIIIYIKFR